MRRTTGRAVGLLFVKQVQLDKVSQDYCVKQGQLDKVSRDYWAVVLSNVMRDPRFCYGQFIAPSWSLRVYQSSGVLTSTVFLLSVVCVKKHYSRYIYLHVSMCSNTF